MEETKVNDWGAAVELEKFKQIYLDPLKEKVDEALGILGDENFKWKKGEKDRAKAKYKRIEFDYINYTTLYHAVLKLIEQHEAQTDMLTEIYAQWYHKVSDQGKQPREMMGLQAGMLQTMFDKIYKAIEPLNLNLDEPKSESDGKHD